MASPAIHNVCRALMFSSRIFTSNNLNNALFNNDFIFSMMLPYNNIELSILIFAFVFWNLDYIILIEDDSNSLTSLF